MVVDVHEWNSVLAYYLRKDCWSRGYATEASKAVIDYMFSEIRVDRISAKHSVRNPASGKVLRKAGMNYMGHVKAYEYITNKEEWHDYDFYALTKEQYFSSKII